MGVNDCGQRQASLVLARRSPRDLCETTSDSNTACDTNRLKQVAPRQGGGGRVHINVLNPQTINVGTTPQQAIMQPLHLASSRPLGSNPGNDYHYSLTLAESSPGRIRTAVLGSKGPDDWPLHHGTSLRPLAPSAPTSLRSVEDHGTPRLTRRPGTVRSRPPGLRSDVAREAISRLRFRRSRRIVSPRRVTVIYK